MLLESKIESNTRHLESIMEQADLYAFQFSDLGLNGQSIDKSVSETHKVKAFQELQKRIAQAPFNEREKGFVLQKANDYAQAKASVDSESDPGFCFEEAQDARYELRKLVITSLLAKGQGNAFEGAMKAAEAFAVKSASIDSASDQRKALIEAHAAKDALADSIMRLIS